MPKLQPYTAKPSHVEAIKRAEVAEARLAETRKALELAKDALGELTEPDPQVYDAYEAVCAALTTHPTTGTPIPEEDQAHCD